MGAGESLGLIPQEKRDPYIILKMFPAADGVLLVRISYEFQSKALGFGAGIKADIHMSLYKKPCDKIFNIFEYGVSKKTVPAVAGIPVMKPEKIQPLCEDATEQLFKDLAGKLGKIVKKSAKKFK